MLPSPPPRAHGEPSASTVTSGSKRRFHDSSLAVGHPATERLPAKTMLYWASPRCQPASDGLHLPASGEPLMLQPPQPSAGIRIREYMVTRPLVIGYGLLPPSDAAVAQHGVDGWRSADTGQVGLVAPEEVLRLVDDDKQPRLAQAFVTDMFFSAHQHNIC